MDIEKKYRDCIICGEHVAEIIRDKNSPSKVRYFNNADVLTIARSGEIFCKNCTNAPQKNI